MHSNLNNPLFITLILYIYMSHIVCEHMIKKQITILESSCMNGH